LSDEEHNPAVNDDSFVAGSSNAENVSHDTASVKPADEPQKRKIRSCWVISNGRQGTQNQALGLAEALAELTPLEILVKRIAIKSPWTYLPGALWRNPLSLLSPKGHLLRAPFPDICIAAGRETVPLSVAIKKKSEQTFVVQTQDPKAPANLFDLVIPPEHDHLSGENVFPILGAPTRVNAKRIERLANEVTQRFDGLREPRIVVLIGGSNRKMKMTDAVCDHIGQILNCLKEQGYGLIVTNSRRTEEAHWDRIRNQLGTDYVRYIDASETAMQKGAYPGVLGLADFIVVTEDSVNMIAEACAVGKPVYTLPLSGELGKFSHFMSRLKSAGMIKPLSLNQAKNPLETWSYEPLEETRRAAEEIVRLWQ